MIRLIDIEIAKWDEFNPKRDQKTYTWLRLSNDILTDPKLFGLDAEQKLCWIEILCQASKKNEGRLKINPDQIAHVAGVKPSKVDALLEHLVAVEIISVHDRARPRDVVEHVDALQITTPTNERTNERILTTELAAATGLDSADVETPFGEILQPRKVKPAVQQSWIDTYEDREWISFQLKKANDWMLANARRAPKSEFARFYNAWLSRSWENHRKTIPITKPASTFCGIGEP